MNYNFNVRFKDDIKFKIVHTYPEYFAYVDIQYVKNKDGTTDKNKINLDISLKRIGGSGYGSYFYYDVAYKINGKKIGVITDFNFDERDGSTQPVTKNFKTYTLDLTTYEFSKENPIEIQIVCVGCNHGSGDAEGFAEFDTYERHSGLLDGQTYDPQSKLEPQNITIYNNGNEYIAEGSKDGNITAKIKIDDGTNKYYRVEYGSTISLYDYRHEHITSCNPPTIVSVTGKTVTVEVDQANNYIACCQKDSNTNIDTSKLNWIKLENTKKYTFNNLQQGTLYNFYYKKMCPDCSDKKFAISNPVEATTWNITGSYQAVNTKKIAIKANDIAGTKGNASNTNIICKLYREESTSSTLVQQKTIPYANKNNINTDNPLFTGLTPNTTYYCYMYTENIIDNDCWITVKTGIPFSLIDKNPIKTDVSATTTKINISWNQNNSKDVECTYLCNSKEKSTATSGSNIVFISLKQGENYEIKYIINDDEGNEISGKVNITTKKITMFEINSTSKIIEILASANNVYDVIEAMVADDAGAFKSITQNKKEVYDELTHDTTYYVAARIRDCYAFDVTNGNKTDVNDSLIEYSIRTSLLDLKNTGIESNQHSIKTTWQATLNGSNCDKDPIDGTIYKFGVAYAIPKKENGYQTYGVDDKKSNGRVEGKYEENKTLYFKDLDWYFCKYDITVVITDGHNNVTKTISTHTTYPFSWIYENGKWNKCKIYVYDENVNDFILAPVFIYEDYRYIESNGIPPKTT